MMNFLTGANASLSIAVIGASGGIGQAFVTALLENKTVGTIHAFSRQGTTFDDPKIQTGQLDLNDEDSIKKATQSLSSLDGLIVTTGFLHDDNVKPEKSLNDLSKAGFEKNFVVNTIGPALCFKYFSQLLPRDKPCFMACLSARVGSVSDNYLGGWYAYRASKAAVNMVIKTTSIEIARKNKQCVVMGLHPGTVDTNLSKPFQGNVNSQKLFSPEQSARYLLDVIDTRTADDTGKVFAWDGSEIPF